MKKKLKDARKDILILVQLGILASFICSAWIVKTIYPVKTLVSMIVTAGIIFALLVGLFLFSLTKEEKYIPIFPFPLDIVLLVLTITLSSYFALLLALQFAESEDTAEFIFKGILFLLSYLGFWCYRNAEKKQYLLYAAIYALSVLASWVLESDDVLCSCSKIMSSITSSVFPPEAIIITIRDFAIPIREAMLLFTIWDNYPRKADGSFEQKQKICKECAIYHRPNASRRKKKKKR